MKPARGWLLSLLVLVVPALHAQLGVPVAKPQRPLADVERVLIVSIDGLRPDRLLLADAPVLHGLLRGGAYTMWARTTSVAITLPSHTSMLTGVTPRKHGIEWNRDLPFSQPVYPNVPTIFEMAMKAGYTTGFVAGKSKLETLMKPGTITHAYAPDDPKSSNRNVVENAVRIIEQHKPELMFVHFPDVDSSGHAEGWGSPAQHQTIAETDAALEAVLRAVVQAGVREKTVVIITADHGGAGRSHGHVGPDDARSRHIPWIANGPMVHADFDLTRLEPLQVNTEDTAATACWLLGLQLPPYFDGKPVTAAFQVP